MIEPIDSERALLSASRDIAGLTFEALADRINVALPPSPRNAKGWVGELLEAALGATAGNRPAPDFETLGIEMKSLPLDARGQPKESTYVCSAPLSPPPGLEWETSLVKLKLNRVLWVPIEGDPAIEFSLRRIGCAFLWTPSRAERETLRSDWEEHMELIVLGRIDELDAARGTYLQVRPKAMNSRERTRSYDADGSPIAANPRGFYLRTTLTRSILERAGQSPG